VRTSSHIHSNFINSKWITFIEMEMTETCLANVQREHSAQMAKARSRDSLNYNQTYYKCNEIAASWILGKIFIKLFFLYINILYDSFVIFFFF